LNRIQMGFAGPARRGIVRTPRLRHIAVRAPALDAIMLR